MTERPIKPAYEILFKHLIHRAFPGTIEVEKEGSLGPQAASLPPNMVCNNPSCQAMPIYGDRRSSWCKAHAPKRLKKKEFIIRFQQGQLFDLG